MSLCPLQSGARFLPGAVTRIESLRSACDGTGSVRPERMQQRDSGSHPHLHRDEDQILVVLEGYVNVGVAGQIVRIGAGDGVFIPRNTVHTSSVAEPTARFVVFRTALGFALLPGEIARSTERHENTHHLHGNVGITRLDGDAMHIAE